MINTLNFEGPHKLFGAKSLLTRIEDFSGIYLWTVRIGDYYKVNYVGESINVIQRLRDQVSDVLTLWWSVYETEQFKEGHKLSVFTPGPLKEDDNKHFEYVRNYYENPGDVIGDHLKFLKMYEIFCAPVNSVLSLKGIEKRCISDALKGSGVFLDNQRPSGYHILNEVEIEYNFEHGEKILGLNTGVN